MPAQRRRLFVVKTNFGKSLLRYISEFIAQVSRTRCTRLGVGDARRPHLRGGGAYRGVMIRGSVPVEIVDGLVDVSLRRRGVEGMKSAHRDCHLLPRRR